MRYAILILATMCLATTAFADVKIKTRQTMSGQTTESTTFIKGKRSRTELMNGMMTTLTQCDLGRDIQLNSQTKTYTATLYDDGTVGPASEVKPGQAMPATKGGTMYVTTTIKDTGERKQMFGYTARHIIQTVETDTTPDSCNPFKSKMEMDMWVIDAEFGLTCLQNRNYVPYKSGKNGGCHEKIVPKTIGSAKSGYPLWQKMTMFEANGKESYSMISEVVELSKATLEASLFDVPAGYREVKDASEMYTAAANYTTQQGSGSSASYGTAPSAPSAVGSSIRNAANPSSAAAVVGAKVPGTIRIGLAGVKTAAVGEGVSAADLSAAVQNSLQAFLKGTKVEIVPLEAKLASALASEAKEKECDFVLAATASHKKGGGGGFGGFGKMLGSVVAQTGIGHTGSTAGNIAGQMATNAIVSASQFSGNIKNKDEISLDLKLTSLADNSTPIARVFKAKAKGDGDDIVSAIIEQAAQALLDAIK